MLDMGAWGTQNGISLRTPGSILGVRQLREKNNGAGTAIAASGQAAIPLGLEIIAGPLDVLSIIQIGAKIACADNSGSLSLLGMDFCVFSGGAGFTASTYGNLPLEYQPPPILTIPKLSNTPLSISVAPPPALYRRDLDQLSPSIASVDRFIVWANFYLANTDAVNPHTATGALDCLFRVVQGGDYS
jgi:hypothetical protein